MLFRSTCVGVVKGYIGTTEAIGNAKDTGTWFLNHGWRVTQSPVKGDIVVMQPGFPGANGSVGHVGIFQDMTHLYQNTNSGATANPPCSNAGVVAWATPFNSSSLVKFYTKNTGPTPTPTPIPTVFKNGSSTLFQDQNWGRANLTIKADNLNGQTINVHFYRTSNNQPNGPVAREWNLSGKATSNTITFYDMDGAGPMNGGTTYFSQAAMNQLPSKSWPIPCAAVTGGQGLCDALRRP